MGNHIRLIMLVGHGFGYEIRGTQVSGWDLDMGDRQAGQGYETFTGREWEAVRVLKVEMGFGKDGREEEKFRGLLSMIMCLRGDRGGKMVLDRREEYKNWGLL
eukprot:TRINITY_DN17647_c0_g1_i1.p3 TRINITY_DN17647_c0_g1~~TRINITY_DN17647_c0_g1_i1.p3  ORF type:complete len:103 (-),score=13.42 TRINITY_DN17647_c0_g1_i1:252-560(-)